MTTRAAAADQAAMKAKELTCRQGCRPRRERRGIKTVSFVGEGRRHGRHATRGAPGTIAR